MGKRNDLQDILETILESKEVYYQSPGGRQMHYPAILYSRIKPSVSHADNKKYTFTDAYSIIVIDRIPDNPAIRKILDLDYTEYSHHYVADNLNHDVINIYY